MPLRQILFCLIVAGSALASASVALAIGYYNLPGSFCQCFGYGNGAGYHSCLVLGPSSCWGFCDPNEVRLPCPPQPPYDYYSGGSCNPDARGSWLEGQVPMQMTTPAPLPEPTPAPSAMRPQVQRRPVVW